MSAELPSIVPSKSLRKKRRWSIIAVFLVVAAGVGTGLGYWRIQSQSDHFRVKGQWAIVAGGERHQTTFSLGVSFVSVDDGTFDFDGERAEYSIDPLADPKRIDFIVEGKLRKGIYRWQGERLEILLSPAKAARPAAFSDEDPNWSSWMILERNR